MQYRMVESSTPVDESRRNDGWRAYHWGILAILVIIEIAVSVHLSLLNPVAGHDESWYLINSLHLQGNNLVPYSDHRPPLLPLVLMLFGDHYRLVSGFTHVAATAVVFLIGRRLFSPAGAIGAVMLFMVSVEMRYYNVLMLTELPSMLLILLTLLAFIKRRPLAVGVAAMLLVTSHYSMVSIPPVVGLMYVIRRQWRSLGWYAVGVGIVAIPLLAVFATTYGNPLFPIVQRAAIVGEVTENDVWHYWRVFPWIRMPLLAGGLAAAWWLVKTRGLSGANRHYDFCLLIVGMVVARMVVLQIHYAKDPRFLAVIVPLLMLLSVTLIEHYRGRPGVWRGMVWVVLFAAMAPNRVFLWQLAGFERHPVNQLVELEPAIERFAEDDVIYTDLNCLVVTAHAKRKAVGVEHPGNRHWPFHQMKTSTREDVPEGALYLTWDPEGCDVLASAPPTGALHGTLYLVRRHWAVPHG